MSCTILRPDPQVLFDQIKNAFSSTVLGGGQVIPESNEWYVVSNDYAMAESFYAIADQMWRENNPETACCDNLYRMAAQRGIFPRPASHAGGYARLTGVPGSAIPPNMEIQTEQGVYVTVGTIPLTLSSAGSATVRIQALVPGSAMNSAGTVTTGTIVNPTPGLDGEVQICGGNICGGAEAEECEAFRQRYLRRMAYHPKATMEWIKEKLLEFPCVSRVCVREGSCCRCDAECGECGCMNCGNQIQLYVLFDETFECGIPPQHVVDDINIWLFGEHQGYGEGQVEIGVCGKIYAPISMPVDVMIDIEGCPSTPQKQAIEDSIIALFKTICPSMPLRVRQIELLVSAVLGAHVNTSVRFNILEYEVTDPGHSYPKTFVSQCGDLEPECDILPCLNTVIFSPPDLMDRPC